MALCVATCPQCRKRFRLVWRIGQKKVPLSTVIRLTCPVCAHTFEQAATQLVIFGAGKEQFPNLVIVKPSALVSG